MSFELEFTKYLKELIERELDKKIPDLDPTTSFLDLGIDSMDRIRIIIHVERDYGVEFSEADAGRIKSIQDLISFITEKGGIKVE